MEHVSEWITAATPIVLGWMAWQQIREKRLSDERAARLDRAVGQVKDVATSVQTQVQALTSATRGKEHE